MNSYSRCARKTLLMASVVVGIAMIGCGSNSTKPNNNQNTSEKGDLNSNDIERLSQAVGIQYAAYAELLSIFSEDGAKPLFDASVDLGAPDSIELASAYDRIFAAAESWDAVSSDVAAAIASMDAKLSVGNTGTTQAQYVAESSISHRRSGLKLAESAYDFVDWMTGSRERARKNVVAVVGAAGSDESAVKDDLYQLATTMKAENKFSGEVDLGGSASEFMTKLTEGKLDRIARRLHQEATTQSESNYGAIASNVGKRPLDIAYQEGLEGLKRGTDFYKAAATTLVSAGTSSAFGEGVEKAEDLIEKINTVDPLTLVNGEAESALNGRAANLLVSKTGMSSDAANSLVEGIGSGIRDFWSNVTAAKELEKGGTDPLTLVSDEGLEMGTVKVELKNPVNGLILPWTDGKTGRHHLSVVPAQAKSGDEALLPDGAFSTPVALGDDRTVTSAASSVTVQTGVATPVTIPDPNATTSSNGNNSSNDKTPQLLCKGIGSDGLLHYGCLAFNGTRSELDGKSTSDKDLLCGEADYGGMYSVHDNLDACTNDCKFLEASNRVCDTRE